MLSNVTRLKVALPILLQQTCETHKILRPLVLGLRFPIFPLELAKARYEETTESPLLVETVTPQHIAEVVARWTGIPVSKLTQGEKVPTVGCFVGML